MRLSKSHKNNKVPTGSRYKYIWGDDLIPIPIPLDPPFVDTFA